MRPLTAPEAESGVVGAMMINPRVCEEVGQALDKTHFSDADLGALYALSIAVRSKGQDPDPITLSEFMPTLPSGEDTLQIAARVQIATPSAANAKHYANIVIERSKARRMHDLASQISEIAQSRGKISDQIAQVQQMAMDLIGADESPDVISMKEALGPVFDEMDDRFNGKQAMGIATGLTDLDKHTSLMRPGNLVIIAGRPGTGKTVLGLQVAEKVALVDKGSSLIFSLEMTSKELAKRTLASVSRLAQNDLDTGKVLGDGEASSKLTAAVGKLSQADIRICDKGGLPVSRIASIARYQHRARPLKLIVVDYIGLVAGEHGAKNLNRNQELGYISRSLKGLAKELGIPIIALAQLNRQIETRGDAKPRMSDLRDSGEIEQDADIIIMGHRDMNNPLGQNGLTEFDVLKCRHGKPGGCILQFRGEFARFDNAHESAYDDYHESAPAKKTRSARSMLGEK